MNVDRSPAALIVIFTGIYLRVRLTSGYRVERISAGPGQTSRKLRI